MRPRAEPRGAGETTPTRASVKIEEASVKIICELKLVMVKRIFEEVEEFVNVGEVSHPCQNVKIQGVVNLLSPMKKSNSCAYFDGKICDGCESSDSIRE